MKTTARRIALLTTLTLGVIAVPAGMAAAATAPHAHAFVADTNNNSGNQTVIDQGDCVLLCVNAVVPVQISPSDW